MKRSTSRSRKVLPTERVSISHLLLTGAAIRILLVAYSVFHDTFFRVKYTDIDYNIVVDGAREMLNGGSPFDRTTYRYTPLLAVMMIPAVVLGSPIGKLILCFCDVEAARACYTILCSFATVRSAKMMVSIFVLFNPVVLNVSTRGNSDMVVTLMILKSLAFFSQKKYMTAAALLGFATHFKLFPIIYTFPLILGVWEGTGERMIDTRQRLATTSRHILQCASCFLVAFAIPTLLCFQWFGAQYIDEAFLYHLRREDHRHNFSPYWLLMYLNMARRGLDMAGDYSPKLIAFVPQLIVLFFVSVKLRKNMAHACCIQTILFVAFNKVCTVQYFVWFLPFLGFIFCDPLPSGSSGSSNGNTPTKRTVRAALDRAPASCGGKKTSIAYEKSTVASILFAVTLWSATIPLWVATAYPLEFKGENVFGRLWIVSCIFFVATIAFALWLARIAQHMQKHIFHDPPKGRRGH